MLRQTGFVILAVLVFGVAVPYTKGFDFLDPIFILAYACMSVLFVTPAATEALSGDPQPPRPLLRMLAVWTFGWGLAILMIASGIVAANLKHWTGHLLIPSVRLLLAALFLGGASSLATVAVAGLLAKHWSSQTAKTILRLSFLSLLLFLAVLYRFMPEQWRSTVEQNLTSSGLIHFAIWAASILTVAGVAITSWILRPAKT